MNHTAGPHRSASRTLFDHLLADKNVVLFRSNARGLTWTLRLLPSANNCHGAKVRALQCSTPAVAHSLTFQVYVTLNNMLTNRSGREFVGWGVRVCGNLPLVTLIVICYISCICL